MHGDHVATADDFAANLTTFEELGILAHDQDRSQTHQEDDVEEEAHKARCVEYRLTRFFGIRHREEAHENMRQAGGTKHQTHTQRDGGNRVRQQVARGEQGKAILVQAGDTLDQVSVREVELRHGQYHNNGAASQQQTGLDDLYPGGGDHAAEGDIDHHQGPHNDHGHFIVQTEEQFDQLAGANHLGDEVEADNSQRRDGGHGTDFALIQAVGGNVGEGESAQITQAICHQEQDARPAGEEGQHINVSIVALAVHHGGEAEQGRCRHIVTGNRQAVLEAGDATTGRVEVCC